MMSHPSIESDTDYLKMAVAPLDRFGRTNLVEHFEASLFTTFDVTGQLSLRLVGLDLGRWPILSAFYCIFRTVENMKHGCVPMPASSHQPLGHTHRNGIKYFGHHLNILFKTTLSMRLQGTLVLSFNKLCY